MIKPPCIESGMKVGIFAPSRTARHIRGDVMDRGLNRLKRYGLVPVLGSHIFDLYGHTAGTAADRASDFNEFIEREDIGMIMSVYGGYNSNHLLPLIRYDKIERNPKIIIGFSDFTVILIAVHVKTGLVTFYGPSLITFCQPEFPQYTEKYFLSVLTGKSPISIYPSRKWADDAWWREKRNKREWKKNKGWLILKKGKARGRTLAGNMGTLLHLAGTKYWPDFRGKILFLEDDEVETPETVDRYLTHFREIGVFDDIAGLIIGRFPSSVGFTPDDSLERLVYDIIREYDFPVILDVDFGHTDPMITIPIGIECEVNTYKKEITFLERAVRT